MFDTSLSALTAAGGNSRAARSLRAKLQWRDRFGRWIEMGRGVKFKVRGADGSSRSVIGSFVGAKDSETGQVYVARDPNGLPDGFYDVKSSNAQEFVANLNESQLAERGIELGKDASGNAVGERVAEDIPSISEMKASPAPEGWIAQPGTYAGKKVIETDDGDFRIHYSGKDDQVLLEDHRAAPGQAEEQRSIAEAFKRVSDVDVQREESGDSAYTGLSEGNDEKLASLDRDTKVDQIKFNERQIANERVPLDARMAASANNETLKKELADDGQPYDPEGNDSDEALAARKAAPAAPEGAGTPTASTGEIDTSTFDVSPEGFLVPTGKKTNDISPAGLANFMTAEKEQLGKGGSRLVVDTDTNSAEIYNSADTLDNAKAQAGGLGQDTVLDLAGGKSVSISDGAVDPNAPDVNPNLNGDTSPEAPNAEDRDPNAVEPQRADPGTDAPASDQPDAEAQRPAAEQPAAPAGGDAPDASGTPDAPAAERADTPDIEDLRVERNREVALGDLKLGDRFYDNDGNLVEVVGIDGEPGSDRAVIQNEDGTPITGRNSLNSTVRQESGYSTSKKRLKDYDAGSIEELLERRAKVQAALDNAGDPKDIIALNEQADALDTRIAAEETSTPDSPETDTPETPTRPDAGDIGTRMTENERAREEALRLLNESEGDPLALNDDDYKRLEALATEQERKQDILEKTLERLESDVIPSMEKDYEDLRAQLDEANGVQELDFDADRSAPETEPEAEVDPSGWAKNPLAPTKDEIKNAPAGSLIAEEHDESGDQRIYRKTEDGKWEQLKRDGSGEPSGYTTRGNHFDSQGSRSHYATDEAGTRPENPETARRREEQLERIENPVVPEAQPEPVVAPTPERPEYEEPGDADAAANARAELDDIDAEIENRLAAAENATDPQVQAEHLSRVRTLERQRKIQENALNRALGNEPMDLNGELGWNMRNPENRGERPAAPEQPETSTELPGLPEEAPEATGEGAPAVLDPDIEEPTAPEAEDDGGTLLDALRKHLAREPLSPEETAALERYNQEQANRTLEDEMVDARAEIDFINAKRLSLLAEDDWDEEDLENLNIARDYALDYIRDIEMRIEERDAIDAEEALTAPEAPTAPESTQEVSQRILIDAEEAQNILDGITPGEGGGVFDQKDDPSNPSSGQENRLAAAKAKMQGKELTPEEEQALSEVLDSDILSDNQLAAITKEIEAKPNRANTLTIARPETEQPEYLSTADMDIINAEREDPNFVFDEDLTWRRINEEFPDAVELPNGDLVLDSATNKGKRYETVIRRTRKNRFMVYVMETDQSGERRAKRIGSTEWHSYEALEKRIQQGRKLIHSKSPAGSLARRKDQPTENLGTQSFPQDDILGDLGNPEAELPTTGDEKFDRLLAVAAEHIRNGDADLAGIEAHMERLDKGANAINTIMNAIIGRAQDTYRPDGVNPFQMYDGETAEIGMEFDWTDWHQELNWWLPDGTLNPNRKANPNHGQVHRGRVVGYVKENSDGKGAGKSHTYGDHVWVQLQNSDGSWGTWVKRSAQTLRRAEPGSDRGLPFFSKREEWRTSPEALARRFRVPTAAPEEPVVTHERPRRDLPQSRRLRFTPRGSLSGYSNVPVPKDQPSIAGMIQSGEIRPQIRPVSEARPGMMIVRMDDDGLQHVDSIIRVENLGDGGYRIHAARPDGQGYADVDAFVVPGEAEVALWTAPGLPAPEAPEPKNARRGELVEFDRDGQVEHGVVAFDDGEGNLTVVTPGNEPIDILESNIRPATYQDISREERTDVIEMMESTDIPQYIQDLIMRGILDPGLSRQRYDQILDTLNSFDAATDRIRTIDAILDMIGASSQDRADVRDYLDSTPTE